MLVYDTGQKRRARRDDVYLNLTVPCEYIYLYIYRDLGTRGDGAGPGMPSAGTLPGKALGHLLQEVSQLLQRGFFGWVWFFFLERRCREAPKTDARGITASLKTPAEDARPLGAWRKDARERLGWFCSPVSQPKTPQRCPKLHAVSVQACKACSHLFFFSSSLASSASPGHAIPSKTGFLAAKPSRDSICQQRPAGRRQARP